MWHQEEVEAAVHDLGLLDEALVHVGALRRVVDEVLAIRLGLLEEALAYTLVHDNQGDLGLGHLDFGALVVTVLLADDLVQLFELEVNNLLAHRIADTVSVNENVVWHLTLVVLAIALE